MLPYLCVPSSRFWLLATPFQGFPDKEHSEVGSLPLRHPGFVHSFSKTIQAGSSRMHSWESCFQPLALQPDSSLTEQAFYFIFFIFLAIGCKISHAGPECCSHIAWNNYIGLCLLDTLFKRGQVRMIMKRGRGTKWQTNRHARHARGIRHTSLQGCFTEVSVSEGG